MDRAVLLGVPLDRVTMREAVRRVRMLLDGDRSAHVMTPNAEMLVAATRNPRFHAVLQSTALNVADGMGVVWLSRCCGSPVPERVAGVDLVLEVVRALPESRSVFLLGAAPGVAERAADRLRAANPHLRIAGLAAGSPAPADAPALLKHIRESGASLLLVAYGAPYQDLWIHEHIPSLPSVRVAIGVGGTFDFLAGVCRRAPKWMRMAGLEWLWRLLQEPRRIGRIANAVLVFPVLVLLYRAHSPRRYA